MQKDKQNDTKKVFMKKGACSQALCYLLSREFGTHNEVVEHAADPLAGGIMQKGHQCGMLWGTALAAGIESLKRYNDHDQAIAVSIRSAKKIMESYEARTGSGNCRDVCGYDLSKKSGLLLFMIKFILHIDRSCLDLAEQWLPEAINAASEALSEKEQYSKPVQNCASEAVKMLKCSPELEVIVAGFAGGFGLSGMGCGALAAAILVKSIEWMKINPKKTSYNNPAARSVLKNFLDMADGKILCRDICGRNFSSIDDHTDFVKNGGCADIIQYLAKL